MSKKNAGDLVVDPKMDDRIKAVATDAVRELWDRTVDRATEDPRSRLVTPAMVKTAIEERLRDYLGAGVLLPVVKVDLRADRTGFDIDIQPNPADVSRHPARPS
jgi:hypothetical protein